MIYFVGNKDIFESNPTYQFCEVQDVLDYFEFKEWIEVDTETEGLDPHTKKIIMLQLGDPDNQFVIDVRYINIQLFKSLLETKKVIIQNSKFEYKFFKSVGIILGEIYDTMLAECVIFCGYDKFGYGLDSLCSRYLNIYLDKTTRSSFSSMNGQPFTSKQIEYGALDVTYLTKIKNLQEPLIKKYNLEYCVNLENNVVKALGDIEYNGMYLDSVEWLTNTLNTKEELFNLERKLDSIILEDTVLCKLFKPTYIQGDLFGNNDVILNINYSSPMQILSAVKALGYTDTLTTNDRDLKKLEDKHIFFKILSEHRKVNKIITTYGESFVNYVNKATGRVHTSFWQILNTGRVSSGSKFDNAPNLQNIPADNKFRNCFKARKGFKWVSIDYSGQELRLMADGSGEEGFIDVLNRGEDLHCYAGSMMFKRPITKADKDLRNQAKTINFGKPYGMGPPKLADTLGITIEAANLLFEEYGKAFPVLNKWLADQSRFAKENSYSTTFAPCNRRRWYPEMKIARELREQVKLVEKRSSASKELWKQIFKIEGSTERNGGNQPIQGSGADICKEALVGVRELISDYESVYQEEVAYLICTVHDAIDVEVREDLAEEFAWYMENIMVTCGNKYVSKVKMEVDITITDYWKK